MTYPDPGRSAPTPVLGQGEGPTREPEHAAVELVRGLGPKPVVPSWLDDPCVSIDGKSPGRVKRGSKVGASLETSDIRLPGVAGRPTCPIIRSRGALPGRTGGVVPGALPHGRDGR